MASAASEQGGDAYAALLARLFRARRFGVDLGTERIAALLASMGSPHQQIPTRVAIAGTNGKGSTATMLESIARSAGHRTGLFTSPHPSHFSERFRIDGVPAGSDAIALAASRASAAGGDALTFFEQCTAIAAQLFATKGVTVGIFEVGLGGRLDATRAVEAGVVVVTGVALDHQEVLGDSLAEIAVEKVGAATPSSTLILGGAGAVGSAAALLAAAAAHEVADVRQVSAKDRASVPDGLGLPGRFQVGNAALAIAAARALALSISDADIARGLRAARLACRFEGLEGFEEPEVLLDGAHNPDGAEALSIALGELAPAATLGVFGVSADKDASAILAPICPLLDAMWVTRGSSDRAMDPDALARVARTLAPALEVTVKPLADTVAELGSWQGRVLYFGSLLMVGEARRLLTGEPGDPVDLSDPRVLPR